MRNRTKIWIGCILSFILGLVLMTLFFGYVRARHIVVSQLSWQKLNLVLSQLDDHYVDEIDREKATDAAITAILKELDPHSVYMTPEPLKEAEEGLAGEFEGIGIQFNVPNDTAVVINVIPGGPSHKAGLLSGDRILEVDGRVMAGVKMPQDSMVRMMKGPKGTKVHIVVGRGSERIPFDIKRDRIPEHSVDVAFMVNDTTGYLRLSKFNRTTYMECLASVSSLMAQGMTHLLFDVRENSGGYFDQACNLANDFLSEGALIVYMQGLHEPRNDVNANGHGPFQKLGLSVLIDDGSASASEVFAGAIQDNDRGVIVGRRSYGKGLVQEPLYFSDGSGIRLTIARFYSPSGRCIQKPYSDDYALDIYKRYADGELVSQDSIKVDSTKIFHTVGGRTVYGGGGIIPDVFVPLDTTRVTPFHQEVNKKSAVVRFSSIFFDKHRDEIFKIDNISDMEKYFKSRDIEGEFLKYTASLGIKYSESEWKESSYYLIPQIKGLCARYSKMGEEAYYRYILPIDDIAQKAIEYGYVVK